VSALPFSLGLIPSEAGGSFDQQLTLVGELGLREVELSQADGVELPDLSEAAATRVRARLDGLGIRVRVAGAQTFKSLEIHDLPEPLPDQPTVRAHLAQLEAALRNARALGAEVLRLYAFRKAGMVGLGNPSPILPDGGPIPERVVERAARLLRLAGDRAAEHGLVLGVENVRSCWANTGVNTGRLVAAADHPGVRVCWDPANDYVAGGQPDTSGYAAVRPFVVAAHLKDGRIVDRVEGRTAWAPIGQGEVDSAAQLRHLIRDGFAGLASLETHWAAPNGSKADGTRISFEGLLEAAERAVASPIGEPGPASPDRVEAP
jgi:L-ribulose-5-phosphate 3-epimerase